MIGVLISILLFYLVGLSLISFFPILRNYPLLLRLSIGYAAAAGFIGVLMLFFSLLGIPWDKRLLIGVFCSPLLIAFFRCRINPFAIKPRWRFTRLEKIIIMLIIIAILYVFIEALSRPLIAWDSIASWMMGAKVAYYSHGLSGKLYSFLNFDNPPLLFDQVAFTSILNGSFDDSIIALLFTFYFVSLLGVFYSFASRKTSRTYALLFTFIFATTQIFVRQAGKYDVGYADLPLSFFLFCSCMMLLEYIKNKEWPAFFLSVFFAATGATVKNDALPFFMAIIIILGIFSVRNSKYKGLVAIFVGSVPVFFWNIFKVSYPVPISYLSKGVFEPLRLFPVLVSTSVEFFKITRWHLIWIFFFVLLSIGKKGKEQYIIIFLILFQLLTYIIVYLITPYDPLDQIRGSFDRLLLQIAPLALFSVLMSSYGILNKSSFLHARQQQISRKRHS